MSLEWVAIAVLAVVVLWMFYQLSSIKGDARHAKWRAEEVRREGQRSDNDTLRMLRALARQLGYSWVEPNPEPARWYPIEQYDHARSNQPSKRRRKVKP